MLARPTIAHRPWTPRADAPIPFRARLMVWLLGLLAAFSNLLPGAAGAAEGRPVRLGAPITNKGALIPAVVLIRVRTEDGSSLALSSATGALMAAPEDPSDVHQHFRLEAAGSGWFVHAMGQGEKVFDLSGASVAPGTEVLLWDKHGGDNQRWYIQLFEGDGTAEPGWRFVSWLRPPRVLEAPVDAGARIGEVAEAAEVANQLFDLVPIESGGPHPGSYRLRLARGCGQAEGEAPSWDGKGPYLRWEGAVQGGEVPVNARAGSLGQTWELMKKGDGTYDLCYGAIRAEAEDLRYCQLGPAAGSEGASRPVVIGSPASWRFELTERATWILRPAELCGDTANCRWAISCEGGDTRQLVLSQSAPAEWSLEVPQPGEATLRPPLAKGRVAQRRFGGPARRPLTIVDLDDRLALENFAVSMWLRPEWDDAHCEQLTADHGASGPYWKIFYSNGTAAASRLRLGLSCDRRSLYLEAGEAVDSLTLATPLDDGRPHHLVIACDENGTLVHVDGRLEAQSPVAPADLRRVPLQVGGTGASEDTFDGTVAALRIWRGPIDAERIEALSSRPLREVLLSEEAARLVGHFVQSGGEVGLEFRVPPPELAGIWIREGMDVEAQHFSPTAKAENFDRSMRAHPTWWIGFVSPVSEEGRALSLAREACLPGPDPGPLPQGRERGRVHQARIRRDVLLGRKTLDEVRNEIERFNEEMKKSWAWQLDAGYLLELDPELEECVVPYLVVLESTLGEDVQSHVFRRENERTYLPLAGGEPLLARPDGTLSWGSLDLARPQPKREEQTYTEKWGGGGGIANINYNSAAYDLRKLDLFGMTTGTEGRWLFAMTPSEVGHAWTMVNQKPIPSGLGLSDKVIRCDGQRTMEEIRDATSFAESFSRNFSFTYDIYTTNESFQEELRQASSSRETVLRGEARCERYAVFLDPARARLSTSFKRSVETLRERGLRRDCGERIGGVCRDALERFISESGTHFANAITYGGRGVIESRMDEHTTNVVHSVREYEGEEVMTEVGVQAGPPIFQVSKTLRFGGARDSFDETATEQLSSFMQENLHWNTYGGTGGANYENWQVDDASVIPVFLDLKPVSDLLVPPFFTEAQVWKGLRSAVRTYLFQELLRPQDLDRATWFEPRLIPKKVVEKPVAPTGMRLEPADAAGDVVYCNVHDDGGQNRAGPMWTYHFPGANQVCGWNGSSWVCRRWLGGCTVPSTGETVTWVTHGDGSSSPSPRHSSFYFRDAAWDARACVPGGSAGICNKWVGEPMTSLGRRVGCWAFETAQGSHLARLVGPSPAIHLAGPKRVCLPGSESGDGNCRAFMGPCRVGGGSRRIYIRSKVGGKYIAMVDGDLQALSERREGPVRFTAVFLDANRIRLVNSSVGADGRTLRKPKHVEISKGRLVAHSNAPERAATFTFRQEGGYLTLEAGSGAVVHVAEDGRLALGAKDSVAADSTLFILEGW